jgi:hypothetical protein
MQKDALRNACWLTFEQKSTWRGLKEFLACDTAKRCRISARFFRRCWRHEEGLRFGNDVTIRFPASCEADVMFCLTGPWTANLQEPNPSLISTTTSSGGTVSLITSIPVIPVQNILITQAVLLILHAIDSLKNIPISTFPSPT